MRSLPLKRKVDDLDVYCPNQAKGCEVVTKIGELNSHKDECDYAIVVCTQGCGLLTNRKHLVEHCNKFCQKRMTTCTHCGKKDYFQVIYGEHIAVCEEYPINCPRGCDEASGLKRKDLRHHEEICPLQEVDCPFREAGCDMKVLRKDLIVHMESNVQTHLTKVMMAYCRLKEDFKALSSQLRSPVTPAAVEPVIKLRTLNSIAHFSFASSPDWTTPPFYVLDRYKVCIHHKRGNIASVMLLQKNDELPLPVFKDLSFYELEIRLDEPTNPSNSRSYASNTGIPTVSLSAYGRPTVVYGSHPSPASYPVLGTFFHPSKIRVNLSRVNHCDCGDELGEVELVRGVDKDSMTKVLLAVKLKQCKK